MIKDNTGIIVSEEEKKEKMGFMIKCLHCKHEMTMLQFPRSIIYDGEITFVSNEDKTEFECDMCGNKIAENNKC